MESRPRDIYELEWSGLIRPGYGGRIGSSVKDLAPPLPLSSVGSREWDSLNSKHPNRPWALGWKENEKRDAWVVAVRRAPWRRQQSGEGEEMKTSGVRFIPWGW